MPGIAVSMTGREVPTGKKNQPPVNMVKAVSTADVMSGYINGKERAFSIATLKKTVGGRDGLSGKDGEDGEDGADGKHGLDGKSGQDGKDGEPGKDGKDGITPTDGKPGKDGKNALDGAPGNPGKNGEPGRDGSPGVQGHPGVNGTPGMNGPPGQLGLPGKQGEPGKQGDRGLRGDRGDAAPTYRIAGAGYASGSISQMLGGIRAPVIIDWDTSADMDGDQFFKKNKRIYVRDHGVYAIDGHFAVHAPMGYRGRLGLALNGGEMSDKGYGFYPLVKTDDRFMTVFRWIISLNSNDNIAVMLTEDEGITEPITALPGLCHYRVTRL